jgi:ankyrin repeat protein
MAVLAGCASEVEQPDGPRFTDTPLVTPSESSPYPSPQATQTADSPDKIRPWLDPQLIGAAEAGDIKEVRSLLRKGASARATDATGLTPLIAASYGNHVAVARRLLKEGADPNSKDSSVQSAYLISTSEVGNDPALLDLLLDNGADVQARDSFNGTGLIRASERGYPAIVRRLLRTEIPIDHVNRLGWSALHEAVILGDGGEDYVRVVRQLARAGARLDLPSYNEGLTPLEHAERLGYDQIAEVLRRAEAQQ